MGSERRFTLKRELGSGAFGTVYLAEMESMGGFKKDVAVKLLNESLGNFADASKRLRDEARLLGRLQHRNIVRVDDLLRLDGRWAIVMEYIQGYDLELIIQAREELDEQMSPVAAMEVIAAVASALDAAWSSKAGGEEALRVVHRDIKPSNIRLTHSGEVKVLDFGIARAEFAEREAKTGQIRYGSLGYLSPERLLGEPEVTAGDVFAVGCVAYELLVGEGLGRVELKPESQVLQVQAALERTRDKLAGQPEGSVTQCLALLERCLAYEIGDRPSSAALASEAKQLVKGFEGESLHVFSERALAKLPEVFDDQTRPARGVLTEEGMTTGGTPAAAKPVSNPTLVFDDFGANEASEPDSDPTGSGPSPQPSIDEGAAPAAASQAPEPERRQSPLLWIVGVAAVLLVGLGAASLLGGDETVLPTTPPLSAPGPELSALPAPEVVPATAGSEGAEDVVVDAAAELVEEQVAPAGTTQPVAPEKPQRPALKEPEADEPPPEVAPVQGGPRLRSAKFSVPGASTVSVTCGDVSGTGSSSALLRELPSGTCSVRAEVDGSTLKGTAQVTKPAGFTCTPTEGTLTCR